MRLEIFKSSWLRLTRLLAALVSVGLLLGVVSAQTITVTSASLTQLQQAIGLVPNNGTILLAFDGTIVLTNTLVISNSFTLDATTNSVTIGGANTNRIFLIQSNVTFTLNNVVIANGNYTGTNGGVGVTANNGGSKGAAGGAGTNGTSAYGGAIYNLGTNLLNNVYFLSNTVIGGSGGAGGIGGNPVSIYDTAGQGGSGGNGGSALGGAIFSLGTVVATNCTFTGNGATGGTAGAGGTNSATGLQGYPGTGGIGGLAAGAAIYNSGKLTMINSSVVFNFTQGGSSKGGGPILNTGNGAPGQTGAAGSGGGVYNLGTNYLLNCTFYENLAIGGNGGNGGNGTEAAGVAGSGGNALGGGIYNSAGALVAATNCTFAVGEAFAGTNGLPGSGSYTNTNSVGVLGTSGGANIANLGTFLLKNSLIAYSTNASNVYGSLTDQGYNLSSDNTPTLNGTGSHNYTDPLVQAPAANGGYVVTCAILSNSPAVDAILDNSAPSFDARGTNRPYGPHSDIGAYEYVAVATNSSNTTTISGSVTYNGTGLSGITISLSNGFVFTIVTDANGKFAYSNLAAGTYVLSASATGYSLYPSNVSVVVPPGTNSLAFTATPGSYTVSGQITLNSSTNGFPNLGVSITGTNGGSFYFANTTTDTNGNYSFANLPVGTNTVTPAATNGYTFTPVNQLVIVTNSVTANFVANSTLYNITGFVRDSASNAFSNISLQLVGTNLSGTSSSTAVTTGNGSYSFNNLPAGTYVITPSPAGEFNPTNAVLAVPSVTNANFQIFFSASGFVLDAASNAYSGVTIQLKGTNALTNFTANLVTAANGSFTTNLPLGSYRFIPQPVSLFSPTNVALPSLNSPTNFNFQVSTSGQMPKVAVANGNVNFSFVGLSNKSYLIQSSTNLFVWQTISTNMVGNSNLLSYSVSTNGYSFRFFRAKLP